MPTRTDTLVIGAGSAGLFCALRWAGRGSVTVVESGPDAGDPPPRWALYDYVLPEAHYYRYTDSATGKPVPQGRGLGGGSTVNSAAALRGQPWCYDAWQVPGWTWPDCLGAFRAIESDRQFPDAAHHGADGLIPITRLEPGPLDQAVFDWCGNAGTRASRTTTHPARSATASGRPTGGTAGGGEPGPVSPRPPGGRACGSGRTPGAWAAETPFAPAAPPVPETYCMGAATMSPELHERGTHAVCTGGMGLWAGCLLRRGLTEPGIGKLNEISVLSSPG